MTEEALGVFARDLADLVDAYALTSEVHKDLLAIIVCWLVEEIHLAYGSEPMTAANEVACLASMAARALSVQKGRSAN